MKSNEEEGTRTLNPEDPSRRKMVKALVGGVTVLAAYHTLPTNWSKPLISQISLPAHAATSGTTEDVITLNDPCRVSYLDEVEPGVGVFRVEGYVTPPTAGLAVSVSISSVVRATSTIVDTNSGTTTTDSLGTFSLDITVGIGGGANGVDVVTTVAGAVGSATCSDTEQPNGEQPPPNGEQPVG